MRVKINCNLIHHSTQIHNKIRNQSISDKQLTKQNFSKRNPSKKNLHSQVMVTKVCHVFHVSQISRFISTIPKPEPLILKLPSSESPTMMNSIILKIPHRELCTLDYHSQKDKETAI